MEWLYINFDEKQLKNRLTGRYSIPIISVLENFEIKSNIGIDAELNGLQTNKKIFLANDFQRIDMVKILKSDSYSKTWSYIIFEIFQPYIGIEERRHIYSFVEQFKLYRLVYNSTLIEKKIEKNISIKEKKIFFSFFSIFFEFF